MESTARHWVLGVVAVALVTAAGCGGESTTSALARHLIPKAVLEAPPWKLRIAKQESAGAHFGIVTKREQGAVPSGTPPTTLPLGQAKAVVTRQWTNGTESAHDPLPEGIFTVIDTAAVFRSPADAHKWVASLTTGPGLTDNPIAGVRGASYVARPITDPEASRDVPAAVPGGEPSGHIELVVLERGADVMVAELVGGGSRPTPADAAALAVLQSATAPAG